MKPYHILLLGLSLALLSGCHRQDYTPKPYAFLRIDLPETAYTMVDSLDNRPMPFRFEMNQAAELTAKKETPRDLWVDITYPQQSGVVFLSYKRLKDQTDLRGQTDTSQRLLESHYQFTSGIEEQGYEDREHQVYGNVYYLRGQKVASTCQFWLTDSSRHFLRGALYLNCTPNNDSLAPVIDYIQADIEHLVETLRWN